MNGTDTTTIVYEISGSNVSYQFIPFFGPSFYYHKNGLESDVSEHRLFLSSHIIVIR